MKIESYSPKKELKQLYKELKEKTNLDDETRSKVEKLIKILESGLNTTSDIDAALADLSKDLSNLYRQVNNIVPSLIINGFVHLGLTMACFSALLDETFSHSNPEQEMAAGMKKLVSMLCSPENEKAANILECFREEE